jgi:hypothetical protein
MGATTATAAAAAAAADEVDADGGVVALEGTVFLV